MDEIRFVSAAGALGAGVNAAGLQRALESGQDFIAADAGTTDAGPFFLGSGEAAFARAAVKRDLATVLLARDKFKVPALVGSVGTAGGDPQVDWALEIVEEIARENNLSLRMAVIRSEQDPGYLEQLYREGRIRALSPAPEIDESIFRKSARVVGMMGVEPLQAALEGGADFVLAGRCSDSALYAALPVMRGFPEGLSWHAGKVAECGTMACVGGRGILTGTISRDGAVLRPIGETIRCTPVSVAAHTFYETGDPFLQKEASGTLDLSRSEFTQIDEKAVRITNSAFIPALEYTVKLEGAELVGYQAIMIGGIRDPFIIKRLDQWLAEVRERIYAGVLNTLGVDFGDPGFHLIFHVYGRNGVMGDTEPELDRLPHEVGIVVEVTAPSQALATQIAQLSRQPFLHHGVPEWMGGVTSFAYLHNPAHVERGPVYRFNLNHVAVPHTNLEMFRTEFVEVANGKFQ